jgi:hypothetical protein
MLIPSRDCAGGPMSVAAAATAAVIFMGVAGYMFYEHYSDI